MQLINSPIHESIDLENKILLSGFSLLFDEKFTVAYNYKNIIIESELLDEEVARRIERKGVSENGNIELSFLTTPKISAIVFESITPFNLMHSNNWFHFLIESLPTLLESIIKNKINKNTVIVTGKLHMNMLQVLHAIFENQLNIIQLEPMKAVYSERFYYSKNSFECHELQNGTINTNYYFNKNNIIMLRNTLSKILNFSNNFIKNKKIFVVRRSFQRNIINMNELIELAKTNGYIVVVPESLTFLEQVEIFSSAHTIVGPTGAWLANLLFISNLTCVCYCI